ncbi:MAG TPA: zinc ABC transporter substrate-binding protein [Thermoanaerobaculia bacterium]|nr:zinc ABC transporter substrate-binding protein [Thermoanaerobaculia bacterium]
MSIDRLRLIRRAAAVGALSALWALAACAPSPPSADGRIQVAVSVPPQAYFVDRIGGPRVRVQVMIPPGASETSYAPTPRQTVALARALLYVEVGHPAFLFEANHIARFLAAHPEIRVVDMSQGIAPLAATEAEGRLETPGFFGDEDHHDHAGGDPHVWVAPATVRIAAGNIERALSDIDPPHAAEYRRRLAAFLADVDSLDREIRRDLAAGGARKFMVYHPSWGYFAREYGLEQVAIEAGGREPSAARLIELVERGRREGIRAVFVQRGFARKSAEVIAEELGGRVIVVDPMAYDWIASLRSATRAFREELRRG